MTSVQQRLGKQKRRLSSMFVGPRRCEGCNLTVPREQGGYVAVGRLRQRWLCNKCAEVKR